MYLFYFQSVRLVVEGSNDVTLTCSSVGHQGEITFDKVKRTPLSTLNERLEVDIKKKQQKFQGYLESRKSFVRSRIRMVN